ncbi:MAG: hypothetical protein FWD97_01440 [Defluviitaleaceae bacterium]|nr:hypothetical protein [Defluviitaleaceae bacterium]
MTTIYNFTRSLVGAGPVNFSIARPSSIGSIAQTETLVPAYMGRAMPAPTSVR